jgi:hypothetical protein
MPWAMPIRVPAEKSFANDAERLPALQDRDLRAGRSGNDEAHAVGERPIAHVGVAKVRHRLAGIRHTPDALLRQPMDRVSERPAAARRPIEHDEDVAVGPEQHRARQVGLTPCSGRRRRGCG